MYNRRLSVARARELQRTLIDLTESKLRKLDIRESHRNREQVAFKKRRLLRKYVEDLKDVNSCLLNAVENAERDFISLKETSKVKKEKLMKMKQRLNTTQDQLSQSAREAARQEQMNRDLQADVARREQIFRDLQADVARREQIFRDLQADVARREQIFRNLQADVARREQLNRELQIEVETLREKNTKHREEVAQLRGKMDSMRKEMAKVKEECDSTVKKELAEKQAQATKLLEAQDDVQRLKNNIDHMKEVSRNCSQDFDQLKSKLHRTEQELTTSQEKQNTYRKEVINKNQLILGLETNLDNMQKKYTDCQQELIIKEDEVKTLTKKVIEMQQKLTDHNTQVEDRAHKVRSNAIQEVQAELAEYRARYSACYNEMVENEELVKELKQQLTTAESHKKECMDKLEEKAYQLESLRMELEKAQEQNQCLSNDVHAFKEPLAKYHDCCKKLQVINKAAMDEMQALKKKYEDLEQELINNKVNSRRNLQELSSRKEKEILVLKNDLSNLEEKYQAKIKEVHALKNTLAKFQDYREKLQVINKAAMDEMQDFKTKFEDLDQELINTKENSRRNLQELSSRKEKDILVLKRHIKNLHENYQAKIKEMQDFKTKFEDLDQELINTKENSRRNLQELSSRKEKDILVLKCHIKNLHENYQAKIKELSTDLQRNRNYSMEKARKLSSQLDEAREAINHIGRSSQP